MTASAATNRLSVRLDPDHKAMIERAASLLGQTVSDFVKAELIARSKELIEQEAVIRLSAMGWNQLADLIEQADDQPNSNLQRAAERNRDVAKGLAASSAA